MSSSSAFSPNSGETDINNHLAIMTMPKTWQDYDLKKDQVHRISDLQRFRRVLESPGQKDSGNGSRGFDTIVETKELSLEETIVFLDLDFHKPTKSVPSDDETIKIRLNRDATEIARRALQRLEISLAKKLAPGGKKKKKKNKKRKDASETEKGNGGEPSSSLMVSDGNNGNSEIDTEKIDTVSLCRKISTLTESSSVELNVSLPLERQTNNETNDNGDQTLCNLRFGVDSNLPVILTTQTFESFRSKLFVGIPIVVQTTLLHATSVEVSWFLSSGDDDAEELVLQNSHSFVPEANHIGKSLSVILRPVREEEQNQRYGRSEAYKFQNTIEKLPDMPIVSPVRDTFLNGKIRNGDDSNSPLLRVCTYNILADLYVSRKGTTDGETTYPHVLYEHVEKTRRIPMIVAELLSYHADIICLQEVDGSVYDNYLQPIMMVSGYDGYYSNKASEQREGCAIFWSTEAFEADETLSFNVKNLFEPAIDGIFEREWNSMRNIRELMESNKEIKKVATEKLGQVAQIARLKLKNPRQGQPKAVLVANTHLFWHPMADHIRAMQAFAVVKKIEEIRRGQYVGEKDTSPDPFLLCGDLNSDPLSGVCKLLTTRSIASDHHDCWNYLHEYKWDVDDSDVESMVESGTTAEERRSSHKNRQETSTASVKTPPPSIALPDSFPRIVSGCQPNPPFTNFTPQYIDTLDYVLASQPSEKEKFGFSPMRSAPMPSVEDVKKFVSMPNEFMPSDHVSIVCDLEWCQWDGQSPAE